MLAAYRRWSGVYDATFGALSRAARVQTVAYVNALDGRRVVEIGVGTGLALPLYAPEKRITGIDLSGAMLAQARSRVARLGLGHVEALLEGDAAATGLSPASFDVAVAMFVASVAPDPRALLAEMRRLVRPGGHVVVMNHFSASGGARLAFERALARFGPALGWHPDFPIGRLLTSAELASVRRLPMPPFGLFTLLSLPT